MSRNLLTRIAVALIAIPAILWICYQGGTLLLALVALLAVLGLTEFLIREGIKPNGILFWLGHASVLLILFDAALSIGLPGEISVVTLLFIISGMILSIGKRSPQELYQRHLRLIWGVTYIGSLYPFVYLLGEKLDGNLIGVSGGDFLLFLFALLWVGDTAAMGFGSWLGKHRLAPAVSPNKSVEGFVGGVIGALIVSLCLYFWKFQAAGLWHILAVGLLCSLFGQLGDLVESMWKRSLGIKDSSALIPGHGGILDRFDSLLFAAPVMYIYFKYVVFS